MSPRAKATIFLLIAFLLGIAVGGLGFGVYVARAGGPAHHRDPAQFQAMVLRRLTKELNLRPDQQERVKAVLQESGQEFARLREEMRPRFVEIRARSRERMRAILDSDQQAKLEELRAKWEQRRRERGFGGDEGPR